MVAVQETKEKEIIELYSKNCVDLKLAEIAASAQRWLLALNLEKQVDASNELWSEFFRHYKQVCRLLEQLKETAHAASLEQLIEQSLRCEKLPAAEPLELVRQLYAAVLAAAELLERLKTEKEPLRRIKETLREIKEQLEASGLLQPSETWFLASMLRAYSALEELVTAAAISWSKASIAPFREGWLKNTARAAVPFFAAAEIAEKTASDAEKAVLVRFKRAIAGSLIRRAPEIVPLLLSSRDVNTFRTNLYCLAVLLGVPKAAKIIESRVEPEKLLANSEIAAAYLNEFCSELLAAHKLYTAYLLTLKAYIAALMLAVGKEKVSQLASLVDGPARKLLEEMLALDKTAIEQVTKAAVKLNKNLRFQYKRLEIYSWCAKHVKEPRNLEELLAYLGGYAVLHLVKLYELLYYLPVHAHLTVQPQLKEAFRRLHPLLVLGMSPVDMLLLQHPAADTVFFAQLPIFRVGLSAVLLGIDNREYSSLLKRTHFIRAASSPNEQQLAFLVSLY
ncbi:MAG: hypothetical protein GXO42_00815 [bacterium]|nr:hypothetical protein [bacterium]